MRLPALQTLTWGTIAVSIASALLLARDGDEGLPLLSPLAEHSARPDVADRQSRSWERAAPGWLNNGHVPAHQRRDEHRRGPR